ncbi:MAG: hypothetical protein JWR26_389 [Pedosphaera sp.]|nr:hypothetical protein [Pedosphaera sp.]
MNDLIEWVNNPGYLTKKFMNPEQLPGSLSGAVAGSGGEGTTPGLKPHVLVRFRVFQKPVFEDRKSGVLVLHWSRQIGKSFTLAAWAVDRLLTRPGRLVTVLSNSRDNGAEFLSKCAAICELNGTEFRTVDKSPSLGFRNMRMEIRIRAGGMTGRIKVLAANPRTARGFSGDLILDEFAFHEDSAAIWEAAEPILSSNPDFLCRIASTGNGKHNLFYRIASLAGCGVTPAEPKEAEVSGMDAAAPPEPERVEIDGTIPESALKALKIVPAAVAPVVVPIEPVVAPLVVQAGPTPEIVPVVVAQDFPLSKANFRVSRVSRTEAASMGVQIYDPQTRRPVTPEEARAAALDKRAYDQNYECVFADENMTLLTHELISAAEREDVGEICEQDWTASALERLRKAQGRLYAGFDVGRRVDLSVLTVVEVLGEMRIVRAILRMRDLRLPDQQLRLGEVCGLPLFQRVTIDMTGLGLGLFEYAQREFGRDQVHGINFACSVPASHSARAEGRRQEMVRVTEALAMELLQTYEDRRIQHPGDRQLRDDLRKPEKVTTPGGRVSIAATRDEAGHADHFWSFALALEASGKRESGCGIEVIHTTPRGILLY